MFIFIWIASLYISPRGGDLHSTMFIFISLRNLKGMKYNLIYIPLCLYLYITKTAWFHSLTFIYIPLCLYLYMRQVIDMEDELLFTFHYVYIYINNDNPISNRFNVFTFHYVYIYIIICISLTRCRLHLHSTMFIFI